MAVITYCFVMSVFGVVGILIGNRLRSFGIKLAYSKDNEEPGAMLAIAGCVLMAAFTAGSAIALYWAAEMLDAYNGTTVNTKPTVTRTVKETTEQQK